MNGNAPSRVQPESRQFPDLLERFLEWQRVRGLAAATLQRQTHAGKRFVAWCECRGLLEAREVTRPILERYQRFLYHYRGAKGAPLTCRSQRLLLMDVQAFFRYLTKQNFIPSNPAADLELPRYGQRLPRNVLTVSEVERILNAADIRDPLGLRDRAILETLYSTGIRRRELAMLQIFDLDQERGTILIREGKGKKDRMVPIGDRALAWIARYLEEVRSDLAMEPDDGALFLTHRGERPCPDWLSDMVARYVKQAEIGKIGACHMFRHTMATLMLEGGADIRYIQQMLGHESLDTTAIYTRVSLRKLREIYLATHPGARLQSGKEGKP